MPPISLLLSLREMGRGVQGESKIGTREKERGETKNTKGSWTTSTPALALTPPIPKTLPTPPTPMFSTLPKLKQPGREGKRENKGKGKREKETLKHPPLTNKDFGNT